MDTSLRPALERFLLWADECPDIQAAVIRWPEAAEDAADGQRVVRITVFTRRACRPWRDEKLADEVATLAA
jgi:hypothetical protein